MSQLNETDTRSCGNCDHWVDVRTVYYSPNMTGYGSAPFACDFGLSVLHPTTAVDTGNCHLIQTGAGRSMHFINRFLPRCLQAEKTRHTPCDVQIPIGYSGGRWKLGFRRKLDR